MTARLSAIVDRLASEGLLAERGPDADAARAALTAVEITEATADSREVGPGSLFCAIRGHGGDGHRFLGAAAGSGAVAALVEERDETVSIPQVVVTSGRRAAATAAAALFRDPWDELTLVGITGTNGKTTTAAILRHMFSTRQSAASIGTLGLVDASGSVVPGTEGLTTPGPIETARLMRGLADDGVTAVAMEVSSHALDQARVAAARYDAALYTNLSRDHLDYHGTLESYRESKLLLLDLLKPGGVAVLNVDDPAWRDVESPARTIRFGIEHDADVRAEAVEAGPGGMDWTLRTPDGAVPVRLPLFGMYNVSNALGAAAALWGLGWTPHDVAAALETVPQVPGRLERVEMPEGGPTVLIDFAHTPDALERALAAIRSLTDGRLILVFGAGGDRDRGKRPEMGRTAAAGADISIVTSDNPRTEDPAVIADEIEAGMGSARRERVLDRREAIRRALELAGPRDVVLLAGKGHETYQIRGTEKRPFDERAVVAEILAGRVAGA